MNKELLPEVKELIESADYYPSVSILLPFEPKMAARQELQQHLRSVAARVKQQLTADWPEETVDTVMKKLNTLVSGLDYNSYRRSLAIFVSPVMEKVIYLSVTVTEKIIIDRSFQIRDVVYNKIEQHKFLLLLLSANTARLYLGDNDKLIRVVCDLPQDIHAFENDIAERVSNFSDPAARKETVLHKFIHHVDNSLGLILDAYPLPLLVAGTDKLLGYFKMGSQHAARVVSFIKENLMEQSEYELLRVVAPHLSDWHKTKQQDLLLQIDQAKSTGKLVSGIKEVWKAANRSNNRLLVLEKSFSYPADQLNADTIAPHTPIGQKLHVTDAVDDIIEKVLLKGGDVEIVDDGLLSQYGRLVLVRYYAAAGFWT